MPDRKHVSRLYIHGTLSWPRRSTDLGRSGLFWIVLGRPAAGRSGKSWGALVLVRPGAVWGRPNLTFQKAVYAAYRVCADAHLGVLGRVGAFWSGPGLLGRLGPEASWDRSEAFWHRSEAAFYGVLGGRTQTAQSVCSPLQCRGATLRAATRLDWTAHRRITEAMETHPMPS